MSTQWNSTSVKPTRMHCGPLSFTVGKIFLAKVFYFQLALEDDLREVECWLTGSLLSLMVFKQFEQAKKSYAG